MSEKDDLRGVIFTGSADTTAYQPTAIIGKYVDAKTGEERIITGPSLQERQVRALEDIAKHLAIIVGGTPHVK